MLQTEARMLNTIIVTSAGKTFRRSCEAKFSTCRWNHINCARNWVINLSKCKLAPGMSRIVFRECKQCLFVRFLAGYYRFIYLKQWILLDKRIKHHGILEFLTFATRFDLVWWKQTPNRVFKHSFTFHQTYVYTWECLYRYLYRISHEIHTFDVISQRNSFLQSNCHYILSFHPSPYVVKSDIRRWFQWNFHKREYCSDFGKSSFILFSYLFAYWFMF